MKHFRPQISAIQEIVSCTEKALKLVSDQIADEDAKSSPQQPTATISPAAVDESTATKKPDEPAQVYRALKGVMRVGLLAKGLLLKGDTDVQLIVLCAQKPTKSLLGRVHKILLEKIDVVSPETKFSIIHDQVAETIVLVKTTISDLQPLITCKIMLTSPLVRTDAEEADAAAAGSTGEWIGWNYFEYYV
jgi:zinc finger RNA-binding protein